MPLQNFIARSLPTITAAWLNTVDTLKFTIFGDSTTKAQARAALTSDASFVVGTATTGGAQLTQVNYNGYLALSDPFKRTAAEIAAAVTPTDFTKLPGDILRYGAVAGGSAATNATAINNAMLSNSDVFCNVPGTYQCSSTINVQSNQTVRLAQGVTLQASVRTWAGSFVSINTKTNIRWYGGVIDGNKANNVAGQVGGFVILDSTNVKVFGLASNNCPSDNATLGVLADGFYIGGSSNPGSTDISLIGIKADGNVRQSLSIVRGERISVSDFQFTNTTGNNPGGGIDIEANNIADTLRSITVSNGTIEGCYYGIVFTQAAKNVTCTGVTIRNCRFSSVYFADCDRVTMTGCVIEAGTMSASAPIIDCVSAQGIVFTGNYVLGNQSDTNAGAGVRVLQSCYNILISDNTFELTRTNGVGVGSSALSAVSTLIRVINNTFVDCVSSAAVANTAVIAVAGNSGSGIYPTFIHFLDNMIIDTRSGGNEADLAISVSTSIPLATQVQYRVFPNFIEGPAANFTAGTAPPGQAIFTWDPPNLLVGQSAESANVTVTGAAIGDRVEVYAPYNIPFCHLTGHVTAANTCRAVLSNQDPVNNFDGANSTGWRLQVIKSTEA